MNFARKLPRDRAQFELITFVAGEALQEKPWHPGVRLRPKCGSASRAVSACYRWSHLLRLNFVLLQNRAVDFPPRRARNLAQRDRLDRDFTLLRN